MNDNSDLDGARQVVARAIEKYNVDRAALFAHDGKTPINAPAIHDRELTKLAESVQWATDRAVQLADKTLADIEAQRLAPHADPTSALSRDDLQDANARAQWVREDCAELPLADLAERLRAVAAGGSVASRWLHWRYAKRRWQVESDKDAQDPALSMFAQTLRDLGIVGPAAGLSDEAQRRAEAAGSLKRWAGAQLAQAQTGKRPSTGAKIAF